MFAPLDVVDGPASSVAVPFAFASASSAPLLFV